MRHALLYALLLAGCATTNGRGAEAAESPLVIATADAVVRGCVGERCGVLVDTFRIDLRRGDRLLLRAESDEIDPVIVITGPDGFDARVDDAFADRRDAAVYVEARSRGSYVVEVRGTSERDEGLFSLHSTHFEEPPGDRLASDGSVERTVRRAQLRWLHLEAEEGALLGVRVTSADFDPFVAVFGPTGRVLSNDDAYELGPSGEGRRTDSAVRFAADRSGVYLVAVGAYAGGGLLRITTTTRPPVLADARGGPPASGWAGPEARGRMLGLFVGISAYRSAPLYGAADDAQFLADAFRAARLMRPDDQIVLRDAAATGEAFASAVASLAARARTEDVVFVFYSGHGEARPAPEGTTDEIDGLDETLVLFDGELTDTAVASALDALRASTVVLAIDACRSGGFVDDFVREPGRLGIFSSDADVLSHTAEPHHAGGYLSHHLRRAVLGAGEALPRDGVMQAGELTDALYEGFVADHRLINPEGERQPLQRLTIERGSLRWDDVLWAYPRDEDGSLAPIPDLVLESAAPRSVAGD